MKIPILRGLSFAIGVLSILLLEGARLAAGVAVTHPGWPVLMEGLDPTAGFIWPSVQIVDLWGDGSRRVVIAWLAAQGENSRGSIEIRRGDGTRERRIDEGKILGQPTFVDIDDDGVYEILATRGDGVSLLRADGTVLWSRDRIEGDPVWGFLLVPHCSVGDLDDDGREWIACTTGGWGQYVFDLNGNVRAGWPVETWVDGYAIFVSPTLADLDGDGRMQILAGNNGGWVYCWEPNGNTCDGWPYFGFFLQVCSAFPDGSAVNGEV